MPSLSSLNVSLTPELEKFVRERVSSGRYATSSEVVREGLRLLQNQERETEAALAALKEQLKRGREQAERGEFVDFDAVFEKARTLINRQREKRAPKAS